MEWSSKRRWYQDQPRSVAFVYSLQKIISSRNTADSEKSKKGSFPTHKFPLFRPAREIAEHKKVSLVIYGNFFRLLLCSLSCFRNFRGKGKKALKLLFWEGFGKCKGNYCSYRSGSKCQEHTLSQTPQLAGNLLLCREKVRENEFNAPRGDEDEEGVDQFDVQFRLSHLTCIPKWSLCLKCVFSFFSSSIAAPVLTVMDGFGRELLDQVTTHTFTP